MKINLLRPVRDILRNGSSGGLVNLWLRPSLLGWRKMDMVRRINALNNRGPVFRECSQCHNFQLYDQKPESKTWIRSTDHREWEKFILENCGIAEVNVSHGCCPSPHCLQELEGGKRWPNNGDKGVNR